MANTNGSTARFRVSDATEVPLRGFLLRLRLLEGKPQMKSLKKARLRLESPGGASRVVEIRDFAVMGGKATQERLERTQMLDVLISSEDAAGDGEPVRIGWTAVGPV